MDLKIIHFRTSSNMVVTSKATNNKIFVATMVRIEGDISTTPNKTADSLAPLPDLGSDRALVHRTSHHQIEDVVDTTTICNGLRTTNVVGHRIRATLEAMQDRVILHPHQHLGYHNNRQENKSLRVMMRMTTLSDPRKSSEWRMKSQISNLHQAERTMVIRHRKTLPSSASPSSRRRHLLRLQLNLLQISSRR